MRTIEDFRRMLERRDPTQLSRDIEAAIDWCRFLTRAGSKLSAATRAQIEEQVVRCITIAVQEASFTGPALVVSAAVRAGADRVASARRYGRAGAEDEMRRAGFEPRDYQLDTDDISAMVRAEVRRLLIEHGNEDIAYDLYD